MKLLLLRCPQCNYTLSPGQTDQVVQCANCRSAVAISEGGLHLLDAQYATPSSERPLQWLPFWVYRGQVTITQRRTQGGRSAERDAQAFWGQPRQVFIPAWDISLPEARDMVSELLHKQPPLEATTPPEDATFLPAVVTHEDGRKVVELVIVSIEAGRNDWMESLAYDLQLDSAALWLLPAARKGEEWQILLKKL